MVPKSGSASLKIKKVFVGAKNLTHIAEITTKGNKKKFA